MQFSNPSHTTKVKLINIADSKMTIPGQFADAAGIANTSVSLFELATVDPGAFLFTSTPSSSTLWEKTFHFARGSELFHLSCELSCILDGGSLPVRFRVAVF